EAGGGCWAKTDNGAVRIVVNSSFNNGFLIRLTLRGIPGAPGKEAPTGALGTSSSLVQREAAPPTMRTRHATLGPCPRVVRACLSRGSRQWLPRDLPARRARVCPRNVDYVSVSAVHRGVPRRHCAQVRRPKDSVRRARAPRNPAVLDTRARRAPCLAAGLVPNLYLSPEVGSTSFQLPRP